jgi:ABC-type transport system involved in cytochrome bd biosynthesis fused ATPase/permease subunit
MVFIRRSWTPASADEWTREDLIAIFLSALSYIGLSVGITLSFLLLKTGFIILALTILLILLMHWVIDPKLKTISNEYEKKQKAYLEDLERTQRWEDFK